MLHCEYCGHRAAVLVEGLCGQCVCDRIRTLGILARAASGTLVGDLVVEGY